MQSSNNRPPFLTTCRTSPYALGQWKRLEVYLTEGHVEIDNNHAENSALPTAVGKKNWLSIGQRAEETPVTAAP